MEVGNGTLCGMICRGLMLALHRAGHVELPAPRVGVLKNAIAHRRLPAELPRDEEPFAGTLRDLGPLDVLQVRRGEGEGLFNCEPNQTCRPNDGNPFDYLLALARHPRDVAEHPEVWLPWNYPDARETSADSS